MAASVLLSAESAVPSFTVGHPAGAAAAGTTHHGLSNAPGPASWNRSLDRALDEAAATGALNLSGRKLKEFPRSAAGHDLTDTTRADLSRNRLTELPVEVCMFVSLENLNLYQNCLRSLPESLINLQSLTYLNISRNQLSTLPSHLCRLPLKVLIACNNKLVSLPEDLGKLRQLTELDVSCNEIQTLPPQIGQLEALRDLNIRRNHLVRLPPELAELPLVRLDFSCNKVTTIPVCYRNLRHLQSIILDNNPLQNPPAQVTHICIKGKIHIFKYLNMEACKAASDLPDYDRRPLPYGSYVEDLYSGRPYGALDSGFNSVDSGDKRWSGNEPSDELSDLPLRVAEITKEQRQRRDREREREDHRTGSHVTNGTLEAELEQIDFIDSCTGDEGEDGRSRRGAEPVSLSSQFMAYIERRITREGSPVKTSPSRELRTDDPRHQTTLHNRLCTYTPHYAVNEIESLWIYSGCVCQRSAGVASGSGGGVERVRREAQLAALRYEEERQKTRPVQRDAVMNYVKVLTHTQFIKNALNIECRLKVSLPSDLGAALTDGVVLCHLANHVRPRSIPSIHVPSPAVPKLTMAKCRRNVENFLEACRRIGVPQSQLCLPLHILEERGLPQVAGTVRALLDLAPPKHTPSPSTTRTGPSTASPLAL
uniref:Leucine-rich repeat and calponin homology domain-containing protein 3-like n=1 Tax=Sinocyclocheilus rhinocerous TaxID=307959 RepID=A0A673FNR0_9TELE